MNKSNTLIRQSAVTAFAYIPVADRAKWLRGWRQTARTFALGTLRARLQLHVQRLRVKCRHDRTYSEIGDGQPSSPRRRPTEDAL